MKWRLTDDKRKEIIEYFECQITDEVIKRADGRGFDIVSFSAEIRLDDIIPANRYNPNDWNKFPDVKPPVGVWMRTEYISATGETIREAARYEEFEGNFYWFDELDFETEVDRFRPWED